MRNFLNDFPDDVWNIVMDYKYAMERYEKFRAVMTELYFRGFLRHRPLVMWFAPQYFRTL